MKILAFTDNHTLNVAELTKKAKDVDLVLSLGDMSLMGNYLEDQFIWMNKLGKKVIVIPGNHEDYTPFDDLCMKYENITNLHKKTLVVDGVLFMGFGGGGFSQKEPEFEKLSDTFAEKIKNHKISFLMTHAPPFNTSLDYLPRFDPEGHRGVISFRNFIDKHQPTYALSGHLHETFEIKEKIGQTTIWNVGDEGVIIEV